MKQLIIIRHAKAEIQKPGSTDIDRALCERGKSDAVKMANQLYSTEITPDAIISSTAKRALETATVFAEQYGIESLIKEDFLYGDYNFSDVKQLLIEEVPLTNTVLMVGHNPNLSYIIAKLTGDFHQHLPTAAVTVIDFKIDQWEELQPSSGEMSLFFYPEK
ncbi:MAG: hypothetical protein H6Q17_2333 [Bacteroidetes bacterium]|jgi:phosphohistidine phosphatase|nr:hypothetical protein [Bacteroidota bacterium]